MNKTMTLEELEQNGAVPPLGMVEDVFERDLAYHALNNPRIPDGEIVSICGTQLEARSLGATEDFAFPRALRGAVLSGTLHINYHDASRSGGSVVRLAKSLVAGSTFMFSNDNDVDLRWTPGTRVLLCSDGDGGRPLKGQQVPEIGADDLSKLSDQDLLARIDDIEFGNVSAMQTVAAPLLQEIGSRRDMLRQLFESSERDEYLRSKCEKLPDMYKFVLAESPLKHARLRLHMFRTEYFDVPHSHRWAMTSFVISGTVTNKYYGADHDLLKTYNNAVPPVQMCHRMPTGGVYSFDHTMIHWFHGTPGAVTLTIRGPVDKDISTEFGAEKLNQKFGVDAKMEPDYMMTEEQYQSRRAILRTLNLV